MKQSIDQASSLPEHPSSLPEQAASLPPTLRALLDWGLQDGERLVWAAQPDAGHCRRQSYVALPFGVGICLFVANWWPTAAGGWVPVLLVLMLLGLLLVSSPYLIHSRAKSTVYALTTTRALILSGKQHDALRAYPLAELATWETRIAPDASGHLILETESYLDGDGDTQTREHGFFAIADVRQVESILEGLRRGEDSALVLRRAALWRASLQ